MPRPRETEMAEPVREAPHAGELPCANHSDRLTMVRCSNCGKPICPDCMVFSPVGVKCRECAKLPRSALVTLRPERAAKAVAAGLGAGTLAGLIYTFLLGGIPFLGFFIAIGIGAALGEAVLRASGYYHGRETALIAVASTLWAFLVVPILVVSLQAGRGMSLPFLFDLLGRSLSGRGIFGWLIIALAAYFAWQRNR